jgi:hypothetical protein
VLWKGALAIGRGTAAALAIVGRAFNNDHPNDVCATRPACARKRKLKKEIEAQGLLPLVQRKRKEEK